MCDNSQSAMSVELFLKRRRETMERLLSADRIKHPGQARENEQTATKHEDWIRRRQDILRDLAQQVARGRGRKRERVEAKRLSERDLEEFIAQSHSKPHGRKIATVRRRYEEITARHGGTAWPASGRSVTFFAAALTGEGLKYETIEGYVNIIVHENRASGAFFTAEETELIRRAKLAAKRILGEKQYERTITLSHEELRKASLLGVKGSLDISVLLLIGVASLMRLGELLALTDADMDWDEREKVMTLHIRTSKTDQGRRGAKVHIGCVTARGKCKKSYCPVHRLLDLRRKREGTRLFGVSRSDAMAGLKELITATISGTPREGRCTSHAMRRTGVRLLLEAGVPLATVAEIGRWKGTGTIEAAYARDASDRKSREGDITRRLF